MSEEWDGKERRGKPHEYEFRSIIREELEPIRQKQEEIDDKITEWELAAKWFRMFIIGTVTLVGMIAGAYEWVRHHLR